MGWHYGFKPYVPVAQRRARAAREVARRTKTGQAVSPVRIEGRAIASTFWGRAWCTNLESYSDFGNRLPRGSSYVRNGSVVDLKIESGRITALVSGSEIYEIRIDIGALPNAQWRALKAHCAGRIGTLVELLQGKLSKAVMERVTDREQGLFPKPNEIKMRCSCPDHAVVCKHIAATIYGVGHRLDTSPELLFVLRGVNHQELIEQPLPAGPAGHRGRGPKIATEDLEAIFDIEIDDASPTAEADKVPAQSAAKGVATKAGLVKKATPRMKKQAKRVPKKG
jgi:uncharacterized Zn finger protein